ncbi:MAG: SurA N-terminal domain-containing protein [Senegalia sp. (in: firmicutes)]|uniref:SurA N-terminal domain-containing protein n=1 Tax=Senegalia sp. (in: firmicutes) TaxID=1924098 RepID=UPI003F98EA92
MKKYISILILLLFTIIIFVGCSEEAKGDVIAKVNGDEITKSDIDERIEYTEISQKLYSGDKELNIDFTKKDAFNQIIREKVLFDQAKKLGYDAKTKSEVMEMIEKSKNENDLSNVEPQVRENIEEKYGDGEEFEKEILKEYGYSSMENFYKENVHMLRTTLLITDLFQQYGEELNKKLSEDPTNQIQNDTFVKSWTNYTEHLLKKSDIKILDDEYELKYYGDEWKYEDLDLKNDK